MAVILPDGYAPLDPDRLRHWLAARPDLSSRLGGSPGEWQVREVSDGNLNNVFAVTGSIGGLCIKQALPHVRVVGESWPMPLERAYFEQLYLSTSEPHVGNLAPKLLHYDPDYFALAMEYLGQHVILRRGLIEGQRYPYAVSRVAEYVARRAFGTSVLAERFEQVNDRLAAFSRNHALTRITVDLIFTHPYISHDRNHWTAPQLDSVVAELRADVRLKSAVARLGYRFLTAHETLLHGDLHTGSVMVNTTDTRVIDAEFAIYGPIGFDLGLFVGNLLMAYFSQAGHETFSGERKEYSEWILRQICIFWHQFIAECSALWMAAHNGEGYPDSLFAADSGTEASSITLEQWSESVRDDTLGYAGAEIVRRIVGFAHNADFETIEDRNIRSGLERRALTFARQLLVEPQRFPTFEVLAGAAQGTLLDGAL